jgi:proteasome lid subunit RPN8/RPN11
METAPRIRMSPPTEARPIPAVMPVACAWRWDSKYDTMQDPLAVKVFLTQPAFARIRLHSSSNLYNEVGGVLVGQWYQDEGIDEQFIVAEHVIPARYANQGPVSLTFTHDSLIYFHNTIEEHYPGKRIVGWYHTHPRMHVFMSHYDAWLHLGFFPELWQVALVVEPQSSTAGFFIRQTSGVLDPERYFGFYELNGTLGHSLMHWENLVQTRKESE